MPNLLQLIKQAATEAVEAGNPTNVVYGSVVSSKPLQIQIDQKLILSEEFLVITKNVKDYDVQMDIDGVETNVTIRNGLKVGEKVIMIRSQGGQRYIVIDRLEV